VALSFPLSVASSASNGVATTTAPPSPAIWRNCPSASFATSCHVGIVPASVVPQ
jgi:hypothetical protein